MNIDVYVPVISDNAERIASFREEMRTLAAAQVGTRREYQAYKLRFHTDPEFRAEQEVCDPVRHCGREYPSFESRYAKALVALKIPKFTRRVRLRALALALTFARGRGYRTCENKSAFSGRLLQSETKRPSIIDFLTFEDKSLLTQVEALTGAPETEIRTWVLL